MNKVTALSLQSAHRTKSATRENRAKHSRAKPVSASKPRVGRMGRLVAKGLSARVANVLTMGCVSPIANAQAMIPAQSIRAKPVVTARWLP